MRERKASSYRRTRCGSGPPNPCEPRNRCPRATFLTIVLKWWIGRLLAAAAEPARKGRPPAGPSGPGGTRAGSARPKERDNTDNRRLARQAPRFSAAASGSAARESARVRVPAFVGMRALQRVSAQAVFARKPRKNAVARPLSTVSFVTPVHRVEMRSRALSLPQHPACVNDPTDGHPRPFGRDFRDRRRRPSVPNQRVRAAIANPGGFPRGHPLVNLAPAELRERGARRRHRGELALDGTCGRFRACSHGRASPDTGGLEILVDRGS